mmetsp:Transcript_30669/g.49267  ORF Transcript_30669/g.49267 Transcript_30669/m.49267 type:complete len:500 (+) Transcript_30669:1048-2547(+)
MPPSVQSSLTSIGNNEIDPSAYLDSVGVYISQNQNGIRNLFGTFDNVQVFSGFNFQDSTIGLAYVGSMCDTRFSVGINQVTDGRSFYNAAVVAHEMGHNFNMQHDTVPLVNVMSAVISQNAALEFSEESRSFIDLFMENTYGRAGIFGVPTCLENDRLPLDGPICGDGQVEGNELCDQGFGAFDDFCLEDCTFGPAAVQCSLNEPCCDENLRFRPSTFICRTAIHPECDIEDTCSGSSADCPRDLYQNPGTPCNDVTQFGVLESGLCFLGDCISQSDNCIDPSEPFAVVPTGNEEDACSLLECSVSRNSIQGTPVNVSFGTPCGPTSQCEQMECVPSTTLAVFVYVEFRAGCFECQDESGVRVADSLCEGPNLSTADDCFTTDDGGGMDGSTLALILVAALVGAAIIAAVFYCCCCMKSNRSSGERAQPNNSRRVRLPTPAAAAATRLESGQESVRIVDAPRPGKGGLPPNWTMNYRSDGIPYYFNEVTGQSLWEKPTQ